MDVIPSGIYTQCKFGPEIVEKNCQPEVLQQELSLYTPEGHRTLLMDVLTW